MNVDAALVPGLAEALVALDTHSGTSKPSPTSAAAGAVHTVSSTGSLPNGSLGPPVPDRFHVPAPASHW